MLELIVLIYSCILFLFQILLDLNRKRFSFFDPKHLFQLYFIVQLPLSAFLAVHYGNMGIDERVLFSINPEIRIRLLIYISLAHTVFLIGVNTMFKTKLFVPSILRKSWNMSRVRLILIGILIIGYLSFFLLIQLNGGYSAFINGREVWRAGGMVGQGFILFPCTTLLGTLAVIYTISHKKKLAASRGRLSFFIFVFLCILPALIMGFRGLILIPILQVLVAYNFSVRKIPLSLLVKSIIGIVLAFTIYGIYREFGFINFNSLINLINERPDLVFNIFLRSRGSEIVARVIEVLDFTGNYQFGFQHLVEALTIIVPSFIWDGKPTPISVIFSQTFFGINGGVSPTVLGELYWNSGLFGVISGMYILGILMSLIYNTLLSYMGRDSIILIYTQLFTSFVMIAEAISGYLNGLVLYFYFILPIIFFLSFKQREN